MKEVVIFYGLVTGSTCIFQRPSLGICISLIVELNHVPLQDPGQEERLTGHNSTSGAVFGNI